MGTAALADATILLPGCSKNNSEHNWFYQLIFFKEGLGVNKKTASSIHTLMRFLDSSLMTSTILLLKLEYPVIILSHFRVPCSRTHLCFTGTMTTSLVPMSSHVDYLKLLKCDILPFSIHVIQSGPGGRDGKFLFMFLNINLCQNSMKLKL